MDVLFVSKMSLCLRRTTPPCIGAYFFGRLLALAYVRKSTPFQALATVIERIVHEAQRTLLTRGGHPKTKSGRGQDPSNIGRWWRIPMLPQDGVSLRASRSIWAVKQGKTKLAKVFRRQFRLSCDSAQPPWLALRRNIIALQLGGPYRHRLHPAVSRHRRCKYLRHQGRVFGSRGRWRNDFR